MVFLLKGLNLEIEVFFVPFFLKRKDLGKAMATILFQLLFFFSFSFLLLASSLQQVTSAIRRPSKGQMEVFQSMIGYTFKNQDLMLDALTHASFSRRNNQALHVMGSHVIASAISLHFLSIDPDISSKDLQAYISSYANKLTCAEDAESLGMEELVMVADKGKVNMDTVLSEVFTAMFAAIALDGGMESAMSTYTNLRKWNNSMDTETS